MSKRFTDAFFLPLVIGFLFMIWGAWYNGVKPHSPFSPSWIKAVIEAPVPLWTAVLVVATSAVLGLRSRLSKQKFDRLAHEMRGLKELQQPELREHDGRIFTQADANLDESTLLAILDMLQTDDSYFRKEVRQIDNFVRFFSQASNQYIDPQLVVKSKELTDSLNRLTSFLAKHFFVYPDNQSFDDMRLCMYPELNVDRNGPGTPETMSRYDHFQTQLDALAQEVRKEYAEYRNEVKQHLYT